jgi:ribokinase
VRTVGAPTGIALIHVDAEGRNAITVVAGANALADPDSVDDAALGEHCTLVLQFEVPLAAVTALAQRAKVRGTRVLLNAAPALPPSAAIAAALDVLVVNEHEAQVLAGAAGLPESPIAFAAAWHRRHGTAVVVTLGGAGAVASAQGRLHAAAAPEVHVVDTTGAGDAFVGALAAGLDRGRDWPAALAGAVAAGSLACTAFGAQGALPDDARIDALAAQLEVRTSPLPDA